MNRRVFFGQALAAPMFISAWRSSPPKPYLGELTDMMKAASLPGMVIGAVRAHKTAWITPLGVRSADSPDTVTASTLFQAASLTKQVTAHAAHALRAQGKLDFDRTLVSYVDDLANDMARTVTVRQVLSHSSGFPNWRYADRGQPVPDLKPAFAPGSKFQYSGEGYFYLQRVLEEVSGLGFGQIARKFVFEPLGMSSSTLVWDPNTADRTAGAHTRGGEARTGRDKAPRSLRDWAGRSGKAVEDLKYADYSSWRRESGEAVLPDSMLPNGAASMVTSAEDYARFVAAAMKTPGLEKPEVKMNEWLGWGLGWGIEQYAGHTYLWQWGDNPGFKNFVLAEPATGDAIFVFTNGDSGAKLYDRVVTHATGHDHPALMRV
ncbi:MAG TPA: serine hydrolase domain-containing protein [Bryobacteraceae bacterium]|jgi:CubicO group peptidase (beta-lactamase class C family)|nr:serine hydrolase domain-containing protein [Bryobacteraceae bacterium]